MHGTLSAHRLVCEHLEDPGAVDVARPILSWRLECTAPRGGHQSAWQVIVATSAELAERGEGDLWDSGRREGRETTCVEYGGLELQPHQSVWWRVRVWDEHGAVGPWSKIARWTAGFLGRAAWQAEWIAEPERETFEGCKWMAAAGDSARVWLWAPMPAMPSRPETIILLLASDAALTVCVAGETVYTSPGGPGYWRNPHRIELGGRVAAGEVVSIFADAVGTGRAAVAGRWIMRGAGREQRLAWVDESWRASAEQPTDWPVPKATDGQPARVVCRVGETNRMRELLAPWGTPGQDDPILLPPPPLLRRQFSVRPGLRRALLDMTALGMLDVYLDGRAAIHARFAPGWSDYRRRVYYRRAEVTEQLHPGEHVLLARLMDGWYAGHLAWGRRRNLYGGVAQTRIELRLEYEDGTTEVVGTGPDWRVGYGEVREADLLMGQVVDWRRAQDGCHQPGFDDSAWEEACVMPDPGLVVEAHPGPTVEPQSTLKPISVRESREGVYIFDMGQNMVGVIQPTLTGRAGQPIRLRYAEVLQPDGELYTRNLGCARCEDVIVPAEDGIIPDTQLRGTFHGFRYVEVSGVVGVPTCESITGIVLHSKMKQTGWFECSHPGITKLMENIRWGMVGNYLEVPTDCPQRDERLGWTGDAQAFIGTASCLYDVQAFMTKWMVDLEDSQRPDGAFTDVAPDIGVGAGVAGWGDAGVIVPWRLYNVYGERRILARHYPAMRRWIDYLVANSVDLIRPDSGFGDWLSLNAYTPRPLIGTAFFAHVTHIVAKVARLLGDTGEAARLEELHTRIVAAFQKRFLMGVDREGWLQDVGILEGNTQTGNTLALAFNLLPEAARRAAIFHLVRDIHIRAGHLSTGFLGLPYLLPTLTAVGRNDIAWRLLLREDFPSWLYQIRQGATTMWERWDGWSEEMGFQNPEMNSYNHYAYGAVGEWIFATVAGIDISAAGSHRIRYAPQPEAGINYANARIDTIHGMATSNWRIADGWFSHHVRVPPNAIGEVLVRAPQEAIVEVVLGGGTAKGWSDGAHRFEVEPGAHEFRVRRG
jgi:alpha-L-rhamnosidase